jgi:S1-C subfamily serine protease
VANGIVIYVSAGDERRTEFFDAETIKLGTDASCDLRFEPPAEADFKAARQQRGVWLELRRENGNYRIANFDEKLKFELNNQPLAHFAKLRDGDLIKLRNGEIGLQFFNISRQSALTAAAPTGKRQVRFIEEAALETTVTPEKRDDAKVFLREFVRELVREVSWTTKIIILLIIVAALGGIFYIGTAISNELRRSREIAEEQQKVIESLKGELAKSNDQISNLGESNKQLIDMVSLAPTLRTNYGGGVCLLVGTYSLVDKTSGKVLRYPDPAAIAPPETYEQPQAAPKISESGDQPPIFQRQSPFTTEGSGMPVEFDFVGTGFHVGKGYILTNRHVVQPWTESEQVKMMAQLANGRARLKKLVVYFPNFPQPFMLRVRETSPTEDLAVAQIDPNQVFPDIPVLPLDNESDAVRVGKTVVTLGYPNGPERILAMVDESEARQIQAKYGQSLQMLVSYLAQHQKINPLMTQGAITDLNARRISHDAKTAEGGSGAPLFGSSGRVIGVNFGVFTENAATNMAVPIRFAVPMLKRCGWSSTDEKTDLQAAEINKNANANTKK